VYKRQSIDIVELFKILGLKMDTTIAPTKNVSGKVSMFLNNLTYEDVLDIILISQGLACEKKGDIINIMTAAEYLALYGEKYNEKRRFRSIKLTYAKPQTVLTALGQIKSEIGKVIVDEASGTIFLIDIPEKLDTMEKKIKELDRPLQIEIFYLDFAKAEDMKTQLESALTPGVGEIVFDNRVNKVMVCDYPEKVKKIKRALKQFDREGRQVFLDVEVVSIILRDEYQKGIDWEAILRAHERHSKVDLKGVFPVAPSFTPSPKLSVDNIQLTAGTLSQDHITTTIQALQTFGDTKVLSHEYLSVAEKGEAKIMLGSREPIVMQAINTQQDGIDLVTTIISDQVEFVDVGLKVKIIPEFNEDDIVTLTIDAESSFVKSLLQTDKSYVPIVDKTEATTAFKVQNGTSIMVAGLHSCDIQRGSSAPLSGLSLLGTKSERVQRKEVLIFVTPYFYGKTRIAGGNRMDLKSAEDLAKKEVKVCLESFTLQ